MKRLALLLGFALPACINEDRVLYEVALTGTFEVAEAGGTIHVELHHAVSGEGLLEHPLGLIERVELEPGARELELDLLVPRDEGEGLVVYAWLDRDGDGILCGLAGETDEPAGAIELDAYPAHAIAFELVLDQPCVGPELALP